MKNHTLFPEEAKFEYTESLLLKGRPNLSDLEIPVYPYSPPLLFVFPPFIFYNPSKIARVGI